MKKTKRNPYPRQKIIKKIMQWAMKKKLKKIICG